MFLKKMHSDFRLNVEADETTYMSKCATHIKGAKCDLRLKKVTHELVQNNVIQKEFIAEKLVNGRTSTADRNIDDDMEKAVNKRNTQQEQGGTARNLRNLQGISTCENVTKGPIYTSTPIQQRQDGYNMESSGLTSVKICSLINKIDELDSGIKSIKKRDFTKDGA